MDCLFCKIVNKEEAAKVLYEDDVIMLIMDAYPTVDGHCLIIPKKHYDTYEDIPDELLLHINKIAKEKAPIILKQMHQDALTLAVNYGKSQAIKHYHLHILPNCLSEKPTHSVDEIWEVFKGV